ncbi:formin-like protein 11 [Aristolochia californica]|uniref:formin-like protein 11 n=1 Tax=Aristolochia californica TaxID=171875 RepID=UPI0035D91EE8
MAMVPFLRFFFVLIFFLNCIYYSDFQPAKGAPGLTQKTDDDSGMSALYRVEGTGGETQKDIQKVSGEDQTEIGKVLYVDKVRVLLGLVRSKMSGRRVNHVEHGLSLSPSPSQEHMALPPAPLPLFSRHKHSRPPLPHRSLVPPQHDSWAQGSDRESKNRVRKIVVVVVVSVGGTFAIAGLISMLLCKKFRRTRKRRSRTMNHSNITNKVSFDPGPDIFYLNPITPISNQVSFVKPSFETVNMVAKETPIDAPLYEMGESSGETEDPEKVGCSSVEQVGTPLESLSFDDESFHSVCNSRSSNARFSNASEACLSNQSGMSSPSFCSKRSPSPDRTNEVNSSSPPVIPPVTPDIPPPQPSYLNSSFCSSPCHTNHECRKYQWRSTCHKKRVLFDSSQFCPSSVDFKLSGTSPNSQVTNQPTLPASTVSLPRVLAPSSSQSFEMKLLKPGPSLSSPDRVPSKPSTVPVLFHSKSSTSDEPFSLPSTKDCHSLPRSSLVSANIPPPPCPPPPPQPPPLLLLRPSSQKKGNSIPESPPGPANIPPPPCPPLSPFLPPAVSKGGKAAGVPPPPPFLAPQCIPIGKDGAPLPKLKPLHWDKVRANPDRSMVWDKLKSSSFELDEEMIESLFGYNLQSSTKNEELRSKTPSPIIHILEPKRLQNITILSKALNASIPQICDSLIRGDGLCTQQLEALAKMVPTKEEEDKLSNYEGDINELGQAERFVKEILSISFAFPRIEAMLYRETFEDEVVHLRRSFAVLEEACKELRSNRLFLKLLEAVLKTGNRMNVGTIRGGAKAFKLDALLKLADVKGTDGKTTLLHFVVQEMVRSEGIRESEINAEKNDKAKLKTTEEREEDYRELGLDQVSGLSTELCNVKKTATIDLDVLASSVSNLSDGMVKLRRLVIDSLPANGRDNIFAHTMRSFLNHAENNIKTLKEDEDRVLLHVRDITEYFHGDLSRDDANPLRIFVIVRDFLGMLDRVCKEVKVQKVQNVSNSPVPFRFYLGDGGIPLTTSNLPSSRQSLIKLVSPS